MLKIKVAFRERGIVEGREKFILPFIFKHFNPENTNQNPEPIVTFAFSMFILSLIVLICFINVMGYIISLYLISKYNIDTKYPKLNKYFKYYTKSTEFFTIIETITALVCLIIIVILNFYFYLLV